MNSFRDSGSFQVMLIYHLEMLSLFSSANDFLILLELEFCCTSKYRKIEWIGDYSTNIQFYLCAIPI